LLTLGPLLYAADAALYLMKNQKRESLGQKYVRQAGEGENRVQEALAPSSTNFNRARRPVASPISRGLEIRNGKQGEQNAPQPGLRVLIALSSSFEGAPYA
jgi:hypothetical protein